MSSSKELEKLEYESNKRKLIWYKDKMKPVSRDVGLFATSAFLMIGVFYGWGITSLEHGNWYPIIASAAIGFLLYRGFENTRLYGETIKADILLFQRKIDQYEKALKDESKN